MTRLLYLEQPDHYSCEAILLDCLPIEGRFALVLDQSPFYPEGGGQPCDQGFINGLFVSDVQKNADGTVLHYTDEPCALKLGDKVTCEVNAQRRLDLSQQHTGQHLLSAAAYHSYDAKTVGFHLSEAYTTIDLDKKLSSVDIEALERTCFEMIAKNMPVAASYPSEEALGELPLRKQPKVTESIRVVQIGDFDYSPCGGTHLTATSGLMGVKIIKNEAYKGGTRLTFVAGYRFIETLQQYQRSLDGIAQRLSSPVENVLEGFEKREQQNAVLKEELNTLKELLLDRELGTWLEALEEQLSLGEFSPLTIRQFEERSLDDLKRLSQRFVEAQDASAVFITNKLPQMTQFVFVRPKSLSSIDCKALLAELAKQFETKGGGSPLGVQGSLVKPEETEAFIQLLEQLYSTSLESN